jgi:dihydroorotase
MNDLVLTGGSVLTEDGVVESDVGITDGTIVEIGSDLVADTIVECDAAWVGPGFVDLHTHMREPGEEWKEDISSGSAAAARSLRCRTPIRPSTPAIWQGSSSTVDARPAS